MVVSSGGGESSSQCDEPMNGFLALDMCPKCGQNVCEHTSVADVINLPNSVSQDFSTYSSDSSLIKQLFGDTNSSNLANNQSQYLNHFNNNNRISLNPLNQNNFLNNNFLKYNEMRHHLSQLNSNNQNFNNLTFNNFMPSYTLRPLSCQFMIMDNETTDKLLRDFFDSKPKLAKNRNLIKSNKNMNQTVPNNENEIEQSNTLKNSNSNQSDLGSDWNPANPTSKINKIKDQKKVSKTTKKNKFSNFRLFLKSSGSKDESKSSPNKRLLRTSGLVNCLTSSASSSSSLSCEELKSSVRKSKSEQKKHRLFIRKSKTNNSNDLNEQNESSDASNTTIKLNSMETNKTDIDESNKPTRIPTNIKNKTSPEPYDIHQSAISLNSKLTTEVDDEDDYNEMQNLELCPIVASDADDDDLQSVNEQPTSKLTTETYLKQPNTFNNVSIYNNNNNTVNNCNSTISVPLNNYLYYNYEKKEGNKVMNLEANVNRASTNKITYKYIMNSTQETTRVVLGGLNRPKSSSSSNATDSSTDITEINRGVDYSSSTSATLTRPLISNKSLSISQHSLTKVENTKSPSENIFVEHGMTKGEDKCVTLTENKNANYKNKDKIKKSYNKHRASFFSSCSSCDTSIENGSSSPSTSTTNTKSNASTSASNISSKLNEPTFSPKYHSITVIFILIGLFSINFFQEWLLLFYYYNSEQLYWFIYSLVGLFSGQSITLILFLLAEIDLINLSPPRSLRKEKFTESSSNTSSCNTDSSTTSPRKQTDHQHALNEKLIRTIYDKQNGAEREYKLITNNQNFNIYINEYDSNYNSELYSIFKNPFSKLCLLIPGYLPISVYIQFFKHVFNYRKAPAHLRFKLEFQLSLHLFFSGIFHSLPLAIINSCYLASKTKTSSSSWYYTELFSIFKSTSYSSSSSSSIFLDSSSLDIMRKNNLLLILVSIFISVSIGICLFITYYELMKQMNFLSILTNNSNKSETGQAYSFISNQANKLNEHDVKLNKCNEHETNKLMKSSDKDERLIDPKLENLGLVEILVYFCYRFCLIISRLSVIAVFWYLFNEWVLLAALAHVLFGYLSNFFTIKANSTTTKSFILENNKSKKELLIESKTNESNEQRYELIIDSAASSLDKNQIGIETAVISINDANLKKKSKINQHLTLFIICLLSFIDLFMNQLSELYHIKKVFVYYSLHFLQNFTVLTYWLVKTIMNARSQLEKQTQSGMNENYLTKSSYTSEHNESLISAILKSSLTTPLSQLKQNQAQLTTGNATFYSPTTYACYATLIYLCIILFTIFGLVLKFLHLHILRKRYRKLFD